MQKLIIILLILTSTFSFGQKKDSIKIDKAEVLRLMASVMTQNYTLSGSLVFRTCSHKYIQNNPFLTYL